MSTRLFFAQKALFALFLVPFLVQLKAVAQTSTPPPLPRVDAPVTDLPSTTSPDANKAIVGSNDPATPTAPPAPVQQLVPPTPTYSPFVVPSGATYQSGTPLIGGSPGGSIKPVARTATVIDEILLDYSKSVTFADFMRKMGPKVLPGDDIFLAKKIYMSPDLLKVKRMPALTLESGSFYIRAGKNETIVRAMDSETLDFDVNHQKISMPPFSNASFRWNKMIDAMTQVQTSWISFLPVAFAVENAGAPTLSSLMAFSIISRISRANSKLETQVLVDKTAFSFTDMWKKTQEFKSSTCTDQLMLHLAQRMAEIQVSTLSCNKSKQAVFELPSPPTGAGNDDAKRSFVVDFKSMQVEESAPGLASPIRFRRDHSNEVNLDYGGTSSAGRSIDMKQLARTLTMRMKGTKWKPYKEDSPDAIETGEHIRELANVITTGDLCHRCGSFFEHAAKLIRLETDPELLQQQAAAPSAPATDAAPAGAPQPVIGR
jgi:hypothetical protein